LQKNPFATSFATYMGSEEMAFMPNTFRRKRTSKNDENYNGKERSHKPEKL